MVTVIPACPRCGETDWWWEEAGNYKSTHALKNVALDLWAFAEIDHEEDIEASYFWCVACGLNKDDELRPDDALAEAWDKVNDQLYELRDELEWVSA